MPLRYSGGVPRNIPQKPQPRRTGSSVFPSDLITGNRRYYIQIEFVNYRSGSFSNLGLGFGGQTRNPSGGVILPVPSSLADVSVLNWEQTSLLQQGEKIEHTYPLFSMITKPIPGIFILKIEVIFF